MAKTFVDITISLDGFIAGADVSAENPMGNDGVRLHNWFFDGKTEVDEQLQAKLVESAGAVIIGAHIYRTAIDTGWDGQNPFPAPVFILAHNPIERVVDGFTVVNDGIESALKQASAVAGDKSVWIMGGANMIQQYLKAGLVDELHIHIAPVLFGEGTRLFDNLGADHVELELLENLQTPGATHLRFRVMK